VVLLRRSRHKDKRKWHTHTAESCRTRKAWLETNPPPVALVADAAPTDSSTTAATPPDSTGPSTAAPSTSSDPADLTVLLATCLQQAGNSPILQALIADAIDAAEDEL
jgi:hypothetical protein